MATVALTLVSGALGCGKSVVENDVSRNFEASSKSDSTDPSSPSAQKGERPVPPSDADLVPSQNRNGRGTPLGLLCWSATQVALDLVPLVSVRPPSKDDPIERSAMVADLQAFRETLQGSLDELPSVTDELPEGALQFYRQFYDELARTELALSSNGEAILADPTLIDEYLSGLFLYENYNGYSDFAVLAEADHHGCNA